MIERPVAAIDSEDLRRRAEETARRVAVMTPQALDALSSDELRRTLHELHVHQVELEMQNEELRRAQAELDAARARYVDLYELAPVGYCTLGEHGLVVEANLTLAALLGVTRVDLLEQPISRFIVGDDQDAYYRLRARLVETRAPQACELRMMKAGGGPLWVHLDVAVKEADGGAECLVAVSDITDRMEATEALRRSQAMLARTESLAHIGSWERDLRTEAVTWSDEMYRIFGRDTGDLPPKLAAYRAHCHPDDLAPLERALDLLLREGRPYEMELRVIRPDGETRVCLARAFAERGAGGAPTRIFGSFQDITDRLELQARVMQSERLVSMGLLAAGVAHEINNPLTYVLFNVETLAADLSKIAVAAVRCRAVLRQQDPSALTDGALDVLRPDALEDAVARAREAFEGGKRIKAITQNLSRLSRVQPQQETLFDINRAIETAATMAQHEIAFRAHLVKDLGPVPAIRGLEGKVSQVLLNLLINAAQAIDEGNSAANRIGVRTWVEGDDVLVEVSDTGRGIAPENLEHIFDPFFTTKAVGKGTGLGLAICRSIATELGGDIRVESTVGKGSRFVLRLPTDPASEPRPADPTPPEPSAAPGVRGRVLVVDDEPSICRTMDRLVGRAHEVVTVGSAVQAQRVLEQDRAFDVILCDLMMPEMTGMELHAWLVESHPALASRVVFVTGGAFTRRAEEFLASTTNRLLRKPVVPTEVAKLVADLVAAVRTGGSRP
jgi:PAS domain S-box-containing protein